MFVWLGGKVPHWCWWHVVVYAFSKTLSSNNRKLSSCVYSMPRTECHWTRKHPSVVKEVTAFGLSVHETYNKRTDKWNILRKNNDPKKKKTKVIIIIETFFPGMKSDQTCTTQLGESRQGNLSAEGLSVSVKIKLLLLFFFNLFMQFADSDTGLLTYACYF